MALLNEAYKEQSERKASEHDYVTVVQCDYDINKQFINGEKFAGKPLSNGLAWTAHVPDVSSMIELLSEISEHSNRVIIFGYIPEKVNADPFRIVRKEDEDIESDEWGRTKRNFQSSSWCLLDRDTTGNPEFDELTTNEWFFRMNTILPGISSAEGILVPSNSNRVEGFKSNSFHFITRTANVELLPDLGKKLMVKAWINQLGVYKLDKNGAKLKRTIVDCSTFGPERISYEGKPIAPGLEVSKQEFIIREGGLLYITDIDWPNVMPEGFSRFGSSISQKGELTWDTVIETERYGTLTLKEIHDKYRTDNKVRCQATFRESESWNGYVGWHQDDEPFLYDNGTGIKYVLTHPIYTVSASEVYRGDPEDTFNVVLPDEILMPDDEYGELVNALYESMPKPNKMTAFVSANGIISYLSGGKYRGLNKSDTLNIYELVTGNSGVGKQITQDGPTDVIDFLYQGNLELLAASRAGISQNIGTAQAMDDKFVALGNRPDILFTWDEIGAAMETIAKGRNDYKSGILDFALELWSSSHKMRVKRELSGDKGVISSVCCPHLNIIGTATEGTLVNGVSWSFWESGKGPRMLILPAQPYKEKPARRFDDLYMNSRLAGKLKEMFKFPSNVIDLATQRLNNPVRVKWDSDVSNYFYDVSAREYEGIQDVIRNRAILHCKKKAMARAIIRNPVNPVVTMELAEWGDIITSYSHDYQYHLLQGKVGEGVEDRAEREIIRKVEAAEGKWVDQGKLLELGSMRKLDTKKRMDILNYLSDPRKGNILERREAHNPRGKPTICYKLS